MTSPVSMLFGIPLIDREIFNVRSETEGRIQRRRDDVTELPTAAP